MQIHYSIVDMFLDISTLISALNLIDFKFKTSYNKKSNFSQNLEFPGAGQVPTLTLNKDISLNIDPNSANFFFQNQVHQIIYNFASFIVSKQNRFQGQKRFAISHR